MTTEIFRDGMAALEQKFKTQIHPIIAKGYWERVKDLSEGDWARAVGKCGADGKFFPTADELVLAAGGSVTTPEDRALLAWGVMRDAILRVGHNQTVIFEDSLISETVRQMGGWFRVCTSNAEQLDVWGKKEFLALYQALAHLGRAFDGKLVGEHEAKNLSAGFDKWVPKPVLVAVDGLPVPKRIGVGNASPRIENGASGGGSDADVGAESGEALAADLADGRE